MPIGGQIPAILPPGKSNGLQIFYWPPTEIWPLANVHYISQLKKKL